MCIRDRHSTLRQELDDVRDIAAAANSTPGQLMACLANAGAGTRQAVHDGFAAVLPSGVPLTVAELPGEYGSMFNTSVSCVGSTAQPIRVKHENCSGSRAGGVIMLSCDGAHVSAVVDQAALMVRALGGAGAAGLADCTVLLRDLGDAPEARDLLGGAALTVLKAGVDGVSVQCTGSAGPMRQAGSETVQAVAANGFVYVSGIAGRMSNGTDSFAVLESTLEAAGSSMARVVNCVFYVRAESSMRTLFGGFYDVFNKRFPPPPSRTEFIAESECADCAVLTKCIAVL
eukprot:TRINITY_DN38536_c0_g2_i1.p1 TRINITY_DN38536_c0_g2~~TRINITY_DN38536_c0_g2_i1.p1  ORF type:complete len:287 (-),score=84.87 TRINITY_DN38536_c0_g2_i1:233-1093(-)